MSAKAPYHPATRCLLCASDNYDYAGPGEYGKKFETSAIRPKVWLLGGGRQGHPNSTSRYTLPLGDGGGVNKYYKYEAKTSRFEPNLNTNT